MKDFFIDPEGRNSELIKKIGYRIVDLIVENLSDLKKKPIFRYKDPDELEKLFSEPIPEDPSDWDCLLDEIKEKILRYSFFFGHPRYIGHMITQPSVPSIFLDSLISALNQSLFLWEVGPAATHLEREVIRWLTRLFGYGEESGGMFLAGGSVANLSAMLIARNLFISKGYDISKLTAISSDQSHFSLKKAANFCAVRYAEVDTEEGKIKKDKLIRKIEEIRKEGYVPFFLCATAGTTISGSIDPIEEISEICKKYGVWLHVDAAHGGAVIFSERYKGLLDGIELADSIAFDPHKWLYCSIPCATLLIKERSNLKHLLFKAPYARGGRPSQGEASIQGTRSFDALKVWATLKLIGKKGIGKIVEHCIDMTKRLADIIKEKEELELLNNPEINILCFRYRSDDRVNEEIQKRLEKEGKAFLSVATFKGKRALRAVILNFCTKEEDLSFVVDEVIRIGKKIEGGTI